MITMALAFAALAACARGAGENPADTGADPEVSQAAGPSGAAAPEASGQAATSGNSAATGASGRTATSEYWSVTINKAEIAGSLSGTIDAIQYNGDVQHSDITKTPQDGKQFVVLNLTIEKTKNGKAVFSWKAAALEDAEGNRYNRLENDSFLENVSREPRLKATDLTLGSETGYACFETPEGIGALWFVHDGAGGEIRLEIVQGTC
jgi:hypothetical protein